MILVDYSHLVFRMLFVAISEANPKKKNGKYVTEDFKNIFIFLIMNQFIHIKKNFSKYGELVICLDNSSKKYWRKDVCSLYKASRGASRDESDINYAEVFEIIEEFTEALRTNFPFKIIDVDGAEADDAIMVLSRFYSQGDKVLIYSEDKDFFQMLKYDNVDFYRPVAKKWITREEKDLDKWLVEHVCLGDAADEVHRIVDKIWFSDNFKKHLLTFGITDVDDQMQLDIRLLKNQELKDNIFNSFNVYKKNRKGEDTDEIDIYKDIRFGVSNLWKAIEKAGSLDAYVDSHPYMRKRYELNKKLVLEEFIPEHIVDGIFTEFNKVKFGYNLIEIENMFKKYKLNRLFSDINILVKGHEAKQMTLEDFDW